MKDLAGMCVPNSVAGGHAGRVTLPGDGGRAGHMSKPERKKLDHRGPLSIDVENAWYFITICAADHKSWVESCVPRMVGSRDSRMVGSRVPRDRENGSMDFTAIADALLSAARWYHQHGKWRLALFLVMPDHLHFIVHFPSQSGHAGRVTLPGASIIQQYKSYLARTCGLRFQRGFWDTRLRDDAHYAEKFRYICNNPVRKGLCEVARDWAPVIAFDRSSGEERRHRESGGHAGRVTLPGDGGHAGRMTLSV